MASIVLASASSETVNLLGAMNKSGCSAQYWEYSTSEVGDSEDKSPLNDAIDLRKDVHEWELEADEEAEAEAEAFEDTEDGESDLLSEAIM